MRCPIHRSRCLPSSCAVNVTVELPLALTAGVYVRTPVGEICGWTTNSPGLVLADRKIDLLAGFVGWARRDARHPLDTLRAAVLERRLVAGAGKRTAASFTGDTEIWKVAVAVSTPPLAVPPSSCAVTVTVATPFASGAVV